MTFTGGVLCSCEHFLLCFIFYFLKNYTIYSDHVSPSSYPSNFMFTLPSLKKKIKIKIKINKIQHCKKIQNKIKVHNGENKQINMESLLCWPAAPRHGPAQSCS